MPAPRERRPNAKQAAKADSERTRPISYLAGFSPHEQHVVGTSPGQYPREDPRIMPGGQDHPSPAAVTNSQISETAFRRDPPEVTLQKGRPMSGITAILKSVEFILEQQS